MDLRNSVPRSPFAELQGFVWLPRMIDKARATAAGTQGEYHYDCPLDQKFLAFYGLSAADFLDEIKTGATDGQLVKYVQDHALPHSAEEVHQFKVALLDTPPADPEKLAYLKEYQQRVAPGRTDLTSFARVIAVEENHPLPISVG